MSSVARSFGPGVRSLIPAAVGPDGSASDAVIASEAISRPASGFVGMGGTSSQARPATLPILLILRYLRNVIEASRCCRPATLGLPTRPPPLDRVRDRIPDDPGFLPLPQLQPATDLAQDRRERAPAAVFDRHRPGKFSDPSPASARSAASPYAIR